MSDSWFNNDIMKKIKIIVTVLLILILISFVASYIESSYCHNLRSHPILPLPPAGARVESGDGSVHNTFCELNALVSIPGFLLLSVLKRIN